MYVDLLAKTAEVVENPGDATVTIVGREGAGPNHEPARSSVGTEFAIVLSQAIREWALAALPRSSQPRGIPGAGRRFVTSSAQRTQSSGRRWSARFRRAGAASRTCWGAARAPALAR